MLVFRITFLKLFYSELFAHIRCIWDASVSEREDETHLAFNFNFVNVEEEVTEQEV